MKNIINQSSFEVSHDIDLKFIWIISIVGILLGIISDNEISLLLCCMLLWTCNLHMRITEQVKRDHHDVMMKLSEQKQISEN